MIGLVPQELTTDAFETRVGHAVSFSRGLFGKPAEPGTHREGAARPVAVGQAREQDHDAFGRHEAPRADRQGAVARAAGCCSWTSRPPAWTSSCGATCGSWCAALRDSGVTIILTTHYIDEAEEMADRIGVINKGELMLVEDKADLMRKLGKKAADAAAAGTAARRARRRWPATALELGGERQRAGLHLRRPWRARPASPPCCGAQRGRHRLQGPADQPELARGHLREPGRGRSA